MGVGYLKWYCLLKPKYARSCFRLKNNDLGPQGVIALANALSENSSLTNVKYVDQFLEHANTFFCNNRLTCCPNSIAQLVLQQIGA